MVRSPASRRSRPRRARTRRRSRACSLPSCGVVTSHASREVQEASSYPPEARHCQRKLLCGRIQCGPGRMRSWVLPPSGRRSSRRRVLAASTTPIFDQRHRLPPVQSRSARPAPKPGLVSPPAAPPVLPPSFAGGGASAAAGTGVGTGAGAAALLAVLLISLSPFLRGRVALERSAWRPLLLTLRLERPG